MSLRAAWNALIGAHDVNDLPPVVPNDPCPDCGCEDFTAGGATVHGRRGIIVPASAVVCCLGCGARWFGTRAGWRKPHDAAMPPAWAMSDLQSRTVRAQADRLTQRQKENEQAAPPPSRNPARGFNRPPAETGA